MSTLPIPPNPEVISPEKLRYKIIPGLPEHDVVYSVTTGKDGKIYLGVSSEFGGAVHSHFASYDPKMDQFRDIIHLEDLIPEGKDRLRPPHAKIHTSMMAHPDGRILWVSHVTPPIVGEKAHRIFEIYGDPERGYLGSYVFSYDPSSDRVENLGRLMPFSGTRFATLNPELDEIYAVTYPIAHFMVFRLRTGEKLDMGRISNIDALGPCWSTQGCAYTTDDDGYIIRYDPKKEELKRLPVRIPAPPGHKGNRNRVRRIKAGPDGVKLYGLTGLSCHLFEYDPSAGRYGTMRDIGLLMGEENFEAPNNIPQGKSLTFAPDGKIYTVVSVGGKEFPSLHILQVDPNSGMGADMGCAKIPGMLPVHTFQDATADTNGNLYFGVGMPEPPTCLAVFNPSGLAPGIVRDQQKELAPYRMEPEELADRFHCMEKKFAEKRRYWNTQTWPFVNQGSTVMVDLGLEGYDPAIPAGESAVTALAKGPKGRLYGTTSGRRSHLFVWWRDARPMTRDMDFPIDLGLLTFEGKDQSGCNTLVQGTDGWMYGGTWNANGAPGHLFRHNPAGEVPGTIEEFTFYSPIFDRTPGAQVEDLGAPLEGQGIQALASDPRSGLVYGLGTGGGLFSLHPQTRQVNLLANLEGPCLSKAIFCDPAGDVYGSMGEGRIFRYRSQEGRLETLPDTIPCTHGRAYLNALSACTWGRDGRLYAGTTTDGYLFAMDFEHLDPFPGVRSLGKPTWSGNIRALAASNDGMIYGIAGRDDLFSRLFRYDPAKGELCDLGVLQAAILRPWVAQRIDSMTTGHNGEIILGEADRLSHIFVYYPPIRLAEPPAEAALF